MTALSTVGLSDGNILVAVSICIIVLGFVAWLVLYARGSRIEDGVLNDGAVVMISDGMVRQQSGAGRALLGDCANVPIVTVLDRFLGAGAAGVRDAVNRLEMTGEPVDILVRSADGRPFELIGTPEGAMIRLVFRDAQFLHDQLRDAEARVNAADTALSSHDRANETLRALISDAPIIAWHRNSDGEINWSGGEIRTRAGAVTAQQAVELIVARTKLNRQPGLAGQPQKSRIEIVVNDGADSVSLHVIEIVRQDGDRIGFATDAGTAATAERTLTRFVQTMTETFAHLTVGLAIFDRNQTLALFNPALVQLWQVEPAWLARRPSLRDIIDELRATRRLPELQDFHAWRKRLVELFENTEAADYEELWHLADGSNIRVLARPHPHGSLAFIFDDVTERMRLEQRYRHSIDLRRATLDRLTEGIAVFGANGLLQFVNQAFHEIWGTNGETVYAAMHARQLVSFCEDLTEDTDIWHRLHGFITGEENREAWTARLTMRSGRIMTGRFAPLPDGSTMAVFSDVTDSEEITTALTSQNDALEIAATLRDAVADRLVQQLRDPLRQALDPAGGPMGPGGREAAIRAALGSLSSIDTLLIPPADEGTTCDPREVLNWAADALAHRARMGEADLSVAAARYSAPVGVSAGPFRKIAFFAMTRSIECAGGGTISVGAAVNAGALDLSIDIGQPKVSADELTRLVESAIRQPLSDTGGQLNVNHGPDGVLRLRCSMPVSQTENGQGGADDQMQAFGDNIHPLKPSASG